MCILSLTIFGIVLYFIIHYLVLSYNLCGFFFLMPVKNMDNKIYSTVSHTCTCIRFS